MEDVSLKIKLNHMFIKKVSGAPSENIQAAIITAASKMANYSDIANEEQTLSELMKLYELDAERVGSLIGMSPTYVQSLIGYSVDFMDYSRAKVNYDANKSNYDELYSEIARRNLMNNDEKQM